MRVNDTLVQGSNEPRPHIQDLEGVIWLLPGLVGGVRGFAEFRQFDLLRADPTLSRGRKYIDNPFSEPVLV